MMRRLGIVVMVVVALVFAGSTGSQATVATTRVLPAIDLSTTTTGWVPVAFGDAQVSVPATWWVLYNSCPTGSPPGEVLVNPANTYCPAFGQGGPKNVVWLVSRSYAGFRPSSSDTRSVINGFSVYDDRGTYFVPSLGLQLTLSGPLAQRVLHTLTRSPRTVALASGPAPTVPSSWHRLSFAGLAFEAPRWWLLSRTSNNLGIGDQCGTAGVALLPGLSVVLSTDQQSVPWACPAYVPRYYTPEDGVRVDAGSLSRVEGTALSLGFAKHCLKLHGLTACPATSPAYSILVLRVTVPGRSKPVYVSIGLAGDGMVARTILYSLRAAPAIGHPLQVAGTIAGTLVRVGGPSPGAPVALPGQ